MADTSWRDRIAAVIRAHVRAEPDSPGTDVDYVVSGIDDAAAAIENLTYLSGWQPIERLEWDERHCPRSNEDPSLEVVGWEAEALFGYYQVKIEWDGYHASLDGKMFFRVGVFDDPDAAKAAAQADFERRIRSVFVQPPPAPLAEEVANG